MSYFEKFNQAARDVLIRAEFEAIQRDQAQFGPEHLLAAMHRGGSGIAGRALRTLGLREDRLRLVLDHSVDASKPEVLGGAALSDRLKRVLAATVEEWRALGHPEIGPAHMLLGLCRDEERHRSGVLTEYWAGAGTDAGRGHSPVRGARSGGKLRSAIRFPPQEEVAPAPRGRHHASPRAVDGTDPAAGVGSWDDRTRTGFGPATGGRRYARCVVQATGITCSFPLLSTDFRRRAWQGWR